MQNVFILLGRLTRKSAAVITMLVGIITVFKDGPAGWKNFVAVVKSWHQSDSARHQTKRPPSKDVHGRKKNRCRKPKKNAPSPRPVVQPSDSIASASHTPIMSADQSTAANPDSGYTAPSQTAAISTDSLIIEIDVYIILPKQETPSSNKLIIPSSR